MADIRYFRVKPNINTTLPGQVMSTYGGDNPDQVATKVFSTISQVLGNCKVRFSLVELSDNLLKNEFYYEGTSEVKLIKTSKTMG